MDSSIRIEPIRILITTNIPGDSKTSFALTSSMIKYETHISSVMTLSEYPFFSPDVKYPKEVLKRYSYPQIVEFFFDRSRFETVLMNSAQSDICASPNIDYSEFDDTYENVEIENCNVEIMIELLFPTVFPTVNNNVSSFAQYIMNHKQDILTFKGSIPSILNKFASNLVPNYSYLKIGGKTYTITRTVWLNDFFNNPVYKTFIDSYINFELWRKTTGDTLKREREASENDMRKVIKEPAIETILNNEKIFRGLMNQNDTATRITVRNSNIDQQLNSLQSEIRKLFGYANEGSEIDGFRLNFENETIANNILLEKERNGYTDSTDDFEEESKSVITMRIEPISVINSVNDINSNIGIISAFIPGFKLNGSLLSKMTKLMKIIESINTTDSLQTNYFNEDSNSGFDGDDTISDDLKRNKYGKYTDFIDTARTLIAPLRESSNRNLQNAIEDYVNNVSSYFIEYMKYIRNRYVMNNVDKRFPRSDEYFKTSRTDNPNMPLFVGISRTENPTPIYEMHMQIDVIGGEVTDDTKHLLGCDYMGNMLGDKMQDVITRRATVNNKSNKFSIFKVEPTKFYYDLQPNIDKYMNASVSSNSLSGTKNRLVSWISPSKGGRIFDTNKIESKKRSRRKKYKRAIKITRRRK